jgi:hypothetical protein
VTPRAIPAPEAVSQEQRERIRAGLLWVIKDWLSFLEHRASHPALWLETPPWTRNALIAVDKLWRDEDLDNTAWASRVGSVTKGIDRHSKDFDGAPSMDAFLTLYNRQVPFDLRTRQP